MPRLSGGPDRLQKRWSPGQLAALGAILAIPVEGQVHVYRYLGEEHPSMYGGYLLCEETINPERPMHWRDKKMVVETWMLGAGIIAGIALGLGLLSVVILR